MLILLFLWGTLKNGVNWETRLIHPKKLCGCYMLEDIDKQLKMWTLEHFYNVVTIWSLFLTKYYSGDEIKKREIYGVCGMGDRRVSYMVLVGKPDRKRPFGRSGHGWEDTIKMDLQEVGFFFI